MSEKLLMLSTNLIKEEDIKVVYNLIFKNAYYSMECYIEGSKNQNNYSYIENITDDEGEAETFLRQIAKGQVLPVHLNDIARDYFGN